MTKSEVKTITEQKVDIYLTTSKLSLYRKSIREENMENMLKCRKEQVYKAHNLPNWNMKLMYM